MKRITSVARIANPYSKRILSNILNADPLAVYTATPLALKRLLRGLNTKQVHMPPAKGRWSIAYLISHLCDAELAMGFRIRMAIALPGCDFRAYDQDMWAEALHYDKAGWREKLRLFTTLRRAHVSLLKGLNPGEWQRYGMHEERGKETVERMIQMIAGHDVNHMKQIAAIRKMLIRM